MARALALPASVIAAVLVATTAISTANAAVNVQPTDQHLGSHPGVKVVGDLNGERESARDAVITVYRAVLTAEYFGPASVVCSHLTPAGVRSFTAGGAGSCTQAFDRDQRVLRHKVKGLDDSGYTPAQWRSDVNSVMDHLRVSIRGTHAAAIGGESGIPGQTTLVRVAGDWRFSSAPPSLSS